MMTNIHIPPAALEAGARAICEMEYGACDGGDTNPCSCTYWAAHARAAFLAMLEAWEGMAHYRGGWEPVIHNNRKPHLILPLMENPDDKA